MLRYMQRKVINLCASLKADYISNKIDDNKGNEKVLFNILHRNKTKPLLTQTDPQVFADEFATI